MKKPKRQETKTPVATAPAQRTPPVWWPRWWPEWWQWLAALGALFVVFEAYGPALNGEFVFDDRSLPFMSPWITGVPLSGWIGGLRPLLMFSFWIDYRMSGTEPYTYHLTNVVLHLGTSLLIALVTGRLLSWSGVAGRERQALAALAGALFLLHPLQTESVAYVASRSEVLSVFFYFASFAVFVYKGEKPIALLRSLAVVILFGAAVATKEHTLTLPALLLLTDYFWNRGGIRKNALVYGLLTLAGAAGAMFVWQVLRHADTAGFGMQDLRPATYFFTQCRVIWTYARMFVLPIGQNIDPDVPLSQSVLDHGAIVGLAALLAVVAAAWIYRKRWPLASFGVFMFLLLLAPTSSVIPIRDVLAERRAYLPFLGLILILLEFLRRLRLRQIVWTGTALLAICSVLTYQRNQVWQSPLTLWQDTVAKSPNKMRPRFQLARALFDDQRSADAVKSYGIASKLGPVDDALLIDWALALDSAGRPNEALEKLDLASQLRPTAHVYSQIGMIFAKQGRYPEALGALARAEKMDRRFEMTYVYRGNIYALAGDKAAAVNEYQRALRINPLNQPAQEALARVNR